MQKSAYLTRDSLFAALCLGAVFLSFAEIETVTAAMRDGLRLCAHSVVPALFPFFVLTSCILASKKSISLLSLFLRPLSRLLALSPQGAIAFLFGSLFGFPIGARVIAEGVVRGSIDKKEGERLLLFCNNASPAFLIGGVGVGMLGSVKYGIFLFFIQLLLSVSVGILTRKKNAPFGRSSFCGYPKSFSDAVRDASLQIIAVCGYILFFSVISALLTSHLAFEPIGTLIRCFCEIGSGCGHASLLPTAYALPLCAFATCFSGVSVYFQCKDMIRDTPLTMKWYFPIKMTCGAVAALLSLFFLSIQYS